MGFDLGDIWMLSLGTGQPVHDLSQEDRDKIGRSSQDWGIIGWLSNGLLDHMMSASSCVSSHQCTQLLDDRYLRINGQLPRKLMQLDNTSEKRIVDFRSYANEWYENTIPSVKELMQKVTRAREDYVGSLGPDNAGALRDPSSA